MKEYCGRFPINKGLTRKLNFEDFVVYRDPEIGLYAYSEKRGLDVNLMTYNETLSGCTESECIYWKYLIVKEIDLNEGRR